MCGRCDELFIASAHDTLHCESVNDCAWRRDLNVRALRSYEATRLLFAASEVSAGGGVPSCDRCASALALGTIVLRGRYGHSK